MMSKYIGVIAAFLFIALWIAFWLLSGIWARRDAMKRNKSGLFVMLFVLFVSWPFSFFMWLIFRPELKEPKIVTDIDVDAVLKKRANEGTL